MDEVNRNAAAEAETLGEAAAHAQETPELYTITSLEALKVFSDPLRQQIIEMLLDGAKTVKQVAAELDLAPTKLYYHINLLEEHGLIRVTETRIVSGIIEKHYAPAARQYQIKRSLLSPGQNDAENIDTIFDALVEPMRGDLRRSMAAGIIATHEDADQPDAPQFRNLRVWRGVARMTEAQAEVFYARLEALAQEFDDMEQDDDESAQAYNMMMLIFPSVSAKGAKPKRRKSSS